jgi:hypothetical protein
MDNGYSAKRLKILAPHWLRNRYPNALLTTELSIEKYGNALLDQISAAITEEGIFGVEVKGDSDNLNRLERQGWVYSRAASKMWLLCSPSFNDKARKCRPRGWGLLEILSNENAAKVFCAMDVWHQVRLPNAPATLLGILWKSELINVSRQCRLSFQRGTLLSPAKEHSNA